MIDPAYFQDEDDVADLVAGVRRMREIAGQDAFKGLLTAEISPGIEMSDDKALARAVREHATTGHHPVSTCHMGSERDADAVLDAELRVRGVEGLRVVDASAFPDQINGNTNAGAIMMAEKAADMILGKPPLAPELVNAKP